MYKVFQIKLSKEVTNFVNSNDRGHLGAEEKYPEYNAHMKTMRGAEYFKGEMFEHYTNVCNVARNGGLVSGTRSSDPFLLDNLEEVFKVLNGYYFDEDSGEDIVFDNHVSGYKMKTVTRKDGEVIEYRDMHSLSVGDIVYDVEEDTYNIVDSFGYKDITADIVSNISREALNEIS
jgi:hypothetical protein